MAVAKNSKDFRPKSKHTLFLFEGDFGLLQRMHGELGASKVVRMLVRNHIESVEAMLPTGSNTSVNLEDIADG